MWSTRWIGPALFTLVALLLAACGTNQQPSGASATAVAATPAATGDTAGVDHGGMSGDSTAPYDAQFIDSMTMHHQGAITMAKQALTEATQPELKDLAQNIITAQETEITQMQDWRRSWYPDLAPTQGMGMAMGDMEISSDTSTSFDLRFITAMIAHHEGAIAMAKDAQQKAEHQEIKDLANTIVTAQETEIAQMQAWQQKWASQ